MSPRTSISIKDVARLSGTSISTVSRVLDPWSRQKVDTPTREKVEQAIAALGYCPNESARRLKRRKTDTISLVIPSIKLQSFAESDFSTGDNALFREFLEGLIREARKWRYSVKVDPIFDPEAPEMVVETMGYPFCDGVLYFGCTGWHKWRELIERKSVPYILIEGGEEAGASVNIDRAVGIRQAVRHLLEKGHRQIAFCSPVSVPEKSWSKPRYQGYVDEMTAAGLSPNKRLLMVMRDSMELRSAAVKVVAEKRITAMVCNNDAMAWQLVRELLNLGVKVPEEMAVTGFDASPVFSCRSPRLSTVRADRGKLGEESVKSLLSKIEENSPFEGLTLPTEFILGETS